MLKKIIVFYKLKKTLYSVENGDRIIVYVQDDNGNRVKERFVVDSFFPGFLRPNILIARDGNGELEVIKMKNVIQNFSSQRRYKNLLKSVNRKYKYNFVFDVNFKPLSYYD